MGYYLCPRCGGTSAFKQREQRFMNTDAGIGVRNVRQRYCYSCVSVKMDYKLTARDWKIICTVAFVLFGISLINSSMRSITTKYQNTIVSYYWIGNFVILILGSLSIYLYRLNKVKKEDNKFLQNGFYKPRVVNKNIKEYLIFIFIFLFINFLLLANMNSNLVTIKCSKGKKITSVTAYQPKCPPGYKKK